MEMNSLIQSSRIPVTDIVSRMREKKYFVDDSFQRRLVWTERQKIRLIETLLINFPIPEIYLWEQKADPDSGSQTYSIVDGQQRMMAILQFVSNEWPLKTAHLDSQNAATKFSNKQWKDLEDEDKQRIWEYKFNVRIIPNTVSDEQIRAVFRRLNETDRSLNPQELRNAEFNGVFISASEEIADLPFWRKWEVFKDSQVRRMIDIEFASSMLIFLRNGIVSDSAETINKAYDTYNDVYKSKDEDVQDVKEFLTFLDKTLSSHKELQNFFTKTAHIYSLFCAYTICKLTSGPLTEKIPALLSFVREYEKGSTADLIVQYKEGSSSRTRSKSSREKRVDSLVNWIDAS